MKDETDRRGSERERDFLTDVALLRVRKTREIDLDVIFVVVCYITFKVLGRGRNS